MGQPQHPEAHTVIPGLQVMPQFIPSQVVVAFPSAGHGVQLLVPHEATSVFSTHALPHRCEPLRQESTHIPLLQLVVPFVGGGGHTVQLGPQLDVELGTQTPPQRLNPESQTALQLVRSQLGVPLATAGQVVHRAPQVSTLMSGTQPVLQTCWPAGHMLRHAPLAHPSTQGVVLLV